ncbi:hypothetical protein [Vibrio sp. SCSIO 43136]|uniref:hypothetical protein n=1 Tax=Vibrio sp. SCSIO 43136 TaxID=2819101 RepID=UPI002075ABD3|nr:hypothetical protein [Vibrio sp. SCSIO 43136]USD66420.1 hypothetical protein J4N39_06315 [Vibrio sp. SCSIO 43136]
MNYRGYAFYSISRTLVVLFACAATVVDAPSMLMYLLLINLAYAFVVSMRVEAWRKSDAVLVETSDTRWSVNINGIPVNEVAQALFNLHFKSERELRGAFIKLLLPKLVITLGLLAWSVNGFVISFDHEWGWIAPVLAGGAMLFISIKAQSLLRLLMKINAAKWYLHTTDFGTHTYYSAYIEHKESLEPYLVKVFE